MDPEKRAKRQSLKLIISESIMVIAVVAMVIVLAFLVSGYWVGDGFKVERQGMLQISSVPTGATVAVDGEAPWFQRTNTSKVLSSEEHVITLTKDGYDSWSRTITIREGLLYRINYPRLFLKNRTKEPVLKNASTTFATVSPDQNWLLAANNTTSWQLINLNTDKPEPKTLDISDLFTSVSKATGATTGLFTGTIVKADWDSDNDHILIKSTYNNTSEWVLLNVRNIAQSVNITREFATDFSSIRIFDNSASTLLAIKGQNLHKISIPSRQISAVIIENIVSYDFHDQEIIFTALADNTYEVEGEVISRELEPGFSPDYYTGIIKINDSKVTKVTSTLEPVRAYISRFYEDKYITLIAGQTITVYKYDGSEIVYQDTLDFVPEKIKIGHGGEFIFMNTGPQVMTYDMEALEIRTWTLDSESFGWLDGHTLYTVKDGSLIVYDFNGLNRRALSTPVSANFPVTITDNKWLYYFSDDYLTREKIID